MTTYQVYCEGTARRWLPYSDEYRTPEEASAATFRIKKTVEPVREWVPMYRELYQVYLESYQALKDQFRALARIR